MTYVFLPISCESFVPEVASVCDVSIYTPCPLIYRVARTSIIRLMISTDEPTTVSTAAQDPPQLLLQGFGGDDHVSPTQVLDDAAIENEDDDYWDVQSDEDMADIEDEHDENALLSSRDFNDLRRIHLENSNELEIRRYDAFLYDGILSQYRPEFVASPLRNPKTLRVFAHYIHVVRLHWKRSCCARVHKR